VQITDNLKRVTERILKAQRSSGNKNTVKIVAITKTHSSCIIEEIYGLGQKAIGENRIQEAESKFSEIPDLLPKIEKRFVGHLQSNKINKAISLFDTLDAVDSLKLAQKIGKKAVILNKVIPILLEVNTSGESSKFGFAPINIDEMLACCVIDGISVRGLMTIGPLTTDTKRIRKSFIALRKLHRVIKTQLPDRANQFTELSMGMSSDFEIAIEEGTTMVRLGTALFGPRKAKI